MNILELQNTLIKGGLRPNAACFNSSTLTAAEQYCIKQEGNFWEVYYFERGNKNDLHQFPDEASACDFLLKTLLADKTVWFHPPKQQ